MDVLTRAMMPVFVGILLGLGGAISLTRLLASLLYEVRATDPWVLGGVSVMLALSAAGAALVPAARASRVTVVSALQAE
jgi:putative ABC transport system permease protein